MEVYSTTEGGVKKHRHIIVVRENGEPVCTEVQGHRHPLAEKYIVLDEEGIPENEYGFDLLMSENHYHETEDARNLIKEIKIEKMSDEQKAFETIELYKSERKREETSRALGYEAERFCDENNQWTDQQRRILKDKKRACLTINKIKPKMEMLEGYFAESQKQVVAYPVEGGDQLVADCLTYGLKEVCVECNYEQEEMAIWHDEMCPGRGIFHVYIDRAKNIDGDVRIERYKWDHVTFGEHLKMDGSDIEHYTKVAIVSYDAYEQMFPNHKQALKDAMLVSLEGELNPEYNETTGTTSYTQGRYDHATDEETEETNKAKKAITLLEQTRKIYARSVTVHDERGGVFAADNWDDSDVAQLKTIPFLRIIPRQYSRLLVRTVAMSGGDSGTLIYELWKDEEYENYKNPDFDLFPTYYHRYITDDKQMFFGKVELAKDPQRESNKYRSLLADIAVKMVSRSTFYEKDMFDGKRTLNQFKKHGNDPGVTFPVKNIERVPVKEEGFRVPTEYFQMLNSCDQEIDRVMNVNAEFSGHKSASDQSGVALLRKQEQSITGNQGALKNFKRAKMRAFRHAIRLMQECYTAERFMKLLRHEYNMKNGTMKLGGKKVVEDTVKIPETDDPDFYITLKEVERILTNADLTKYDVRIDERQLTPTTRHAYLEMLMKMQAAGNEVDMTVIYELMDLPHSLKMQLIESYQQKMMSQMQIEQQKIQNEEQKPITAGEYKLEAERMKQSGKNQTQAGQ